MSKPNRRKLCGIFLAAPFAAALLLASPSAEAVKIAVPDKDDVFLSVGLLTQPWVYLNYAKDANDPDLLAQFYVRRTRFMTGGQITKYFSFFAETDLFNLGKAGDYTGRMIVQDAFASIDISPALHIMFGFILPPFIHHSYQGATSLHTLDYHGGIVKYPAGSNLVWRSGGVMVRGHVMDNHLEYRLAVTHGVPMGYTDATKGKIDTNGMPRVTGRVVYNVWDAEDGPFTGGTYLGKKKILSFGVAGDMQPCAFGNYDIDGDGSYTCWNYAALGGDIFADIPMGENRVSAQLSGAYYLGKYNPSSGVGLFFDGGYAIGKWEPLLGFYYFRPAKDFRPDSKVDELKLYGGLNYWWVGHNANIKFQVGYDKPAKREMGKGGIEAILQTQVLLY